MVSGKSAEDRAEERRKRHNDSGAHNWLVDNS